MAAAKKEYINMLDYVATLNYRGNVKLGETVDKNLLQLLSDSGYLLRERHSMITPKVEEVSFDIYRLEKEEK